MNNRFSLKKAVRTAVLPAAVVITLALGGCAGSQVENTTTNSPSPVAPSREPTATEPHASAGTPIVMELAGQEIAAELDNSTAALSLLAQLPLTLSFRDYNGQEKVAELPAPLDLAGAPEGSGALPLTIGYYVPDQRLILYYDQVGYFDGIIPIGTYEDTDAVERQSGDFTVTLRAAD